MNFAIRKTMNLSTVEQKPAEEVKGGDDEKREEVVIKKPLLEEIRNMKEHSFAMRPARNGANKSKLREDYL